MPLFSTLCYSIPGVRPAWTAFLGGEVGFKNLIVRANPANLVFWAVLLPIKCYVSYLIEIRPAIRAFVAVRLSLAGTVPPALGDTLLRNLGRSRAFQAFISLFILVPTWLVFIMDAQVWFTLLQACFGVGLGLWEMVGGGNLYSFDSFIGDFRVMESQFHMKLNALFDKGQDDRSGVKDTGRSPRPIITMRTWVGKNTGGPL